MQSKFLHLFYIARTPIHVGSGSELGIVDMPIQREKVTNFPKFEASGIKGCFRDVFSKQNKHLTNIVFGSDDEVNSNSSCMNIIDAKILFFPVKSAGTELFYWITCPFILERFYSEMAMYKIDYEDIEDTHNDCAYYSFEKNNREESKKEDIILLEEYKFKLHRLNLKSNEVLNYALSTLLKNIPENTLYISEKLKSNIIVISDEAFKFFVEMSTEVNTRIRIGDKGIVENGALFTIEYLPAETIMYNFISVKEPIVKEKEKEYIKQSLKELQYKYNENHNISDNLMIYFEKELENRKYVQLGGDKTLGKGITRIVFNSTKRG